MAEKKMTNRQRFMTLLEMAEVKANADMVAFIEHQIELLDNKSKSKKPTATQKANESIKEIILDALTEKMTIGEILKAIQPMVEVELSNQRVSALVRQLRLDGKVERTEDKRKAYFERV